MKNFLYDADTTKPAEFLGEYDDLQLNDMTLVRIGNKEYKVEDITCVLNGNNNSFNQITLRQTK